ncbi:MAG: cation diffusion facilitator family transporter [Bdellovibrionota bacterium]
MGHSHSHSHSHGHHHTHTHAHENKSKLLWVLVLTGVFLIVEIIAGLSSKSLALLADAGHMVTDFGALGLALFGIKIAERPANPQRTYGYYRAEILAALANAILLVGIGGYIFYEAFQRFRNPIAVDSHTVLWVSVLGLGVNMAGIFLLRRGAEHSLNLRAAYLEVFSDAIASLGVIVSAAIVYFTGWSYADSIVSLGIAVFILPRTWRLLSETVGVLLEGTPSDVDIGALRSSIATLPGVAGVHDLHVWALSSGINAMSVHVVLNPGENHDEILKRVQKHVVSSHKIKHATVQVESLGCAEDETHL